jgi:AAA+ superfamily predicted ATPase
MDQSTTDEQPISTEQPIYTNDSAIKSDVKKAQASTAFRQYSTIDDKYYRPANSTRDSLPAGMYRVLQDNMGIFFAKDNLTSDSLMVLPDSKTRLIIDEIKRFRNLKKRYKEFGLLHKRGILMYGPPGSGKSSSIMLLARDMIEVGDIILMCQNPNLVCEALRIIRDIEPHRHATVVMEDIDDIIRQHGEHLLLNVLDGDHQVDNVVFLATTNYIDQLPPRIVNRPSRFDRLVEIGMPNEESRKLYFTNKTGSYTFTDKSDEVYDLAALTSGMSLAHLREVIASVYCLEISVTETIERLKKMSTMQKTEYGMIDRKVGLATI